MKTQTDTNPMDEAYKLLDGEPAGDAVSQAAKGLKPQTAFAQAEADQAGMVKRLRGSQACQDINDAYAMLFEALAIIIKK